MTRSRHIGIGLGLAVALMCAGCTRAPASVRAPSVGDRVASASPDAARAASESAAWIESVDVRAARSIPLLPSAYRRAFRAQEVMYGKPVIYLYPRQATRVRVNLRVDGRVTRSDPALDSRGGWSVTARPSGELVSESGGSHPYLFWEALAPGDFDMTRGFVVEGAATRAFLDGKLELLGLSGAESRQFEDYWVPRMTANAYNLIHFEGPAYERSARLDVTPRPDTMIRVFMAYAPLAHPISVAPQTLSPAVSRHGFVLVEWGGSQLAAH